MKFPALERSNESKELVTLPVTAVPFVAVADVLGVTVTVELVTGGFNGSPLLEIPTPDTVYSHPVL